MYIDPGAGSLVLQALAAGLVSLVVTLRRGREALKSVLFGVARRLRRR